MKLLYIAIDDAMAQAATEACMDGLLFTGKCDKP